MNRKIGLCLSAILICASKSCLAFSCPHVKTYASYMEPLIGGAFDCHYFPAPSTALVRAGDRLNLTIGAVPSGLLSAITKSLPVDSSMTIKSTDGGLSSDIKGLSDDSAKEILGTLGQDDINIPAK